MIYSVAEYWHEPYLDELCEIIRRLDAETFFSESKIKLEKQRQEWPEVWTLIDKLVTIKILQEKFSEE